MRILQVGPVPSDVGGTNTGGIHTHLWGLARHLVERGHQVAVVADNVPYEEDWPSERGEVSVFGTHGFRGPRRDKRLASPRMVREVVALKRHFGPEWSWKWVAGKAAAFAEAFESFGPDVVHVHAPEARFPFAAYLSRTVPVVSTVHSVHYVEFAPAERRRPHRRLIERNLLRARRLVFVSEYVRGQYHAMFGDLLSGISEHVLHNPLDAELYRRMDRGEARRRLGLSAEEPVALFVGNLIERKRPDLFVSAIAEAGALGVVVGEGPEEPAIRELAERLGVAKRVRFEGRKPQEALAEYYSAADVFVLPSAMESFGLVFVEAMLCGCPVLGTPVVLDEILPSEEFGRRVPAAEAGDLAPALRAALERHWDREAIAGYARGFDWDRRIGGFEDMYGEAVS